MTEKEDMFSFSDDYVYANLGANTVTEKGENLFPKLGEKLTFKVTNWDLGFPNEKTGKAKPILHLEMDNGEQYQRVIGSDMKKKIGKLGYKNPEELINKLITFEKYDTHSSNPVFRWGLRIVAISEPKSLK